jgi:hypothetical protein
LRVLRFEVSVCKCLLYKPVLNHFCSGWVGVNPLVEVTVNSKEEISLDFCPNHVQEFGLCTLPAQPSPFPSFYPHTYTHSHIMMIWVQSLTTSICLGFNFFLHILGGKSLFSVVVVVALEKVGHLKKRKGF